MSECDKTRLFVGMMNAHTMGISGGDVWFIEVTKRLDNFEKLIITSQQGETECVRRDLDKCTYNVTNSGLRLPVLLEYTYRTLLALKRLVGVPMHVIYASSDFFPDVVPAFIYKWQRSNLLWVQKIYHITPIRRFPAWLLQKISHLLIRKKADLVIVDNKALADQLVKFGFNRDTVYVSEPGINALSSGTNNHGIARKKEGAVYLGRIHHAKGIEELIEIWSHVILSLPDARLSIIGSGPSEYLTKIRRLVTNKKLDTHISFLGYLDNDLVIEQILKSRVFITASREEGYGMAVLESLSLGTPVVCWDIPAFREAFNDFVELIPTDNILEFSECVVKMLADDASFASAVDRINGRFSQQSWEVSADREIMLIELKLATLS